MELMARNSEVLKKLLSQDKSIISEQLNLSEIRELSLEFFEAGKREGYIDPSMDSQTLVEYFDILREGIAAKPDLASRLGKDSSLINGLSRLILYGPLKKEIDLFKQQPLPGAGQTSSQ